MKKIIVSFFVAALFISAAPPEDFPEATISNGLIKAKLFLPDHEKGYYQATRFDWSGVIPLLEYSGHTYFDTWNQSTYSPKLNDAIMGPVQEFGPLGYNEAKPGETFVKIGVGGLKKIEERSYRYAFTYEIANPGKWTIKKKKDRITFIHELTDASGYSYVYTKTIELVKGKPLMVIQHSLKNTGSKSISTTVYDHNFFVIDKEPTGPNMKMTFAFDVKAEDRGNGSLKGFGTIADVKGKSILYNRSLSKGEQVYSSGLQGFRKVPEDYQFITENTKTGAGAKITSDQVLDKLVYWANPVTACAEPYIQLDVAPGKEIKWKYNYEFFASQNKN
ncbi:MAG: hypothetical protein WDN26_19030 [Chitinophagaceae bacterium]